MIDGKMGGEVVAREPALDEARPIVATTGGFVVMAPGEPPRWGRAPPPWWTRAAPEIADLRAAKYLQRRTLSQRFARGCATAEAPSGARTSSDAGRARLLAQERRGARPGRVDEGERIGAAAENALAVTRLQAQVQSLQSSLVSDADHRQGAWERRVARLERGVPRAAALRLQRLAEADEVLRCRGGAVAAENRLLGERLSHAAREVEARDDEVRRLLERALQAEFDAHATAAEAGARRRGRRRRRRSARAPPDGPRWRWRRSARSTARRATSTWSATSGRARRSERAMLKPAQGGAGQLTAARRRRRARRATARRGRRSVRSAPSATPLPRALAAQDDERGGRRRSSPSARRSSARRWWAARSSSSRCCRSS